MRKKLIYILCMTALFYSCSKTKETVQPGQIKKTEVIKADSQKIADKVKTSGAGSDEGCVYCTTNTPPSQYTGYDNAALALDHSSERYKLYADSTYDFGWADGYRDALYWYNYYAGACGYTMKLQVQNLTTRAVTVIPLTTPIPSGNVIVGQVITNDCSETGQYIQIRCQLMHNCGPQGLLAQYYYNTTYPGVSTAQHSYDMGRYLGYQQGISRQPLGAAPGPQ